MPNIGYLANVTSSEATVQLRWNKGILEQGYKISEYQAGTGLIIRQRLEWRAVPSIADQTAGE